MGVTKVITTTGIRYRARAYEFGKSLSLGTFRSRLAADIAYSEHADRPTEAEEFIPDTSTEATATTGPTRASIWVLPPYYKNVWGRIANWMKRQV